MKIRIFNIPIFLLVADLLLSLPQFEIHIISVIGSLRLTFIPLLILVLIDILRKVDEKRIKFVIGMSWPLLLLIVLFLFQTVVIPPAALPIHLSGCGKFISWFLLYVCGLLSLNSQTDQKIREVLLFILLFVFLATIVQYPIIVHNSSQSLSSIIASNSTDDKSIHGLFAAANEDANSLMTLFPLALFYIKKKSGLTKLILQVILLLYIPIILLLNGTRTALFVTFPIVLFIFNISLSVKNIIQNDTIHYYLYFNLQAIRY